MCAVTVCMYCIYILPKNLVCVLCVSCVGPSVDNAFCVILCVKSEPCDVFCVKNNVYIAYICRPCY